MAAHGPDPGWPGLTLPRSTLRKPKAKARSAGQAPLRFGQEIINVSSSDEGTHDLHEAAASTDEESWEPVLALHSPEL